MTQDPAQDIAENGEPEEQDVTDSTPSEPVRTGVDRIDEVIRAVEDLDQQPIEEHVAVFESAHGRLRRALDEPAAEAVVDPVSAPDEPRHV